MNSLHKFVAGKSVVPSPVPMDAIIEFEIECNILHRFADVLFEPARVCVCVRPGRGKDLV